MWNIVIVRYVGYERRTNEGLIFIIYLEINYDLIMMATLTSNRAEQLNGGLQLNEHTFKIIVSKIRV